MDIEAILEENKQLKVLVEELEENKTDKTVEIIQLFYNQNN